MKTVLRVIALLGTSLLASTAIGQAPNTLPATGNVGIGTTAPAFPLEVVSGTSANIGLKKTGTYAGEANIYNDGVLHLVANPTTDWIGYRAGAHIFANNSFSKEYLRIDSSGNVGIGTSSPSAKLHVDGQTRLAGTSFVADLGNRTSPYVDTGDAMLRSQSVFLSPAKPGNNNMFLGGGLVWDGSDVRWEYATNQVATYAGYLLFDGAAGGLRIATTALAGGNGQAATLIERLTIAASGNIGIGTPSPSYNLQVCNSGQVYSAIQTTTGNQAATVWISGLSWTAGVHGGDSNKFKISNTAGLGDRDRFTIDSSGNVGIGTTNPTNKLEVNGTIRAKEVIVETTGWSDYVFTPDYRLAPLSEVEAHIAANGHLPGIPSAAEVATQGVSVGDMQAKLLAKIEELTLRQIAQEKRIEKLEAENAALLSK